MTINYFKVYLCTQMPSSWTYECRMFNSFQEADAYYTQNYETTRPKSTMLDICKYTPLFLHRPILNYKLGKMHNVQLR
jgi:hypothetical protein